MSAYLRKSLTFTEVKSVHLASYIVHLIRKTYKRFSIFFICQSVHIKALNMNNYFKLFEFDQFETEVVLLHSYFKQNFIMYFHNQV